MSSITKEKQTYAATPTSSYPNVRENIKSTSFNDIKNITNVAENIKVKLENIKTNNEIETDPSLSTRGGRSRRKIIRRRKQTHRK